MRRAALWRQAEALIPCAQISVQLFFPQLHDPSGEKAEKWKIHLFFLIAVVLQSRALAEMEKVLLSRQAICSARPKYSYWRCFPREVKEHV